jgi:hypothetical protein
MKRRQIPSLASVYGDTFFTFGYWINPILTVENVCSTIQQLNRWLGESEILKGN